MTSHILYLILETKNFPQKISFYAKIFRGRGLDPPHGLSESLKGPSLKGLIKLGSKDTPQIWIKGKGKFHSIDISQIII